MQGSSTEALRLHYASIRRQADEKADGWPHAQRVAALCVRDAAGKLAPPSFAPDEGPIGVYAMLRAPALRKLLRACRAAFARLVRAIEELLDPAQRDAFRTLVHWADESSWHVCVSVYHEHPSLLAPSERENWRRIGAAEQAELGVKLARRLGDLAAPSLGLDALVATPDGALIAGAPTLPPPHSLHRPAYAAPAPKRASPRPGRLR